QEQDRTKFGQSDRISLALPLCIVLCDGPVTEQMKDMVWMDFQVDLSTTTISNRLLKLLYTVKQAFADQLVQHQENGDLVVYYDETNFNLYCKRSQGRALKGNRATAVLPPSKASSEYQGDFAGKKIVVVLDNSPAHCQIEDRITKHDDLILLRLGPYSPMCNPIEACFSVLKSRIKSFLALGRDDMLDIGTFRTLTERRMTLLENAAKHAITCITPRLVARMTVHCQRAVEAARR
ncbi:hypothetical protein BBJ28_00023117, partial [Nothophytophthora sp. Chile5]